MPKSEFADMFKAEYRKNGLANLDDCDILRYFLESTLRGQKAEAMTEVLLKRFGSIESVFNAELYELKECGLPMQAAIFLKLIMETYLLADADRLKKTTISNSEMVKSYFKRVYRGVKRETVKLAMFNKKLKITDCIDVISGDINRVRLEIPMLINIIKCNDCRYCVIAHNHPGKSCRPSEADISATKELISELYKADIMLLDHIIVGNDGAISLINSSIFHASYAYGVILQRHNQTFSNPRSMSREAELAVSIESQLKENRELLRDIRRQEYGEKADSSPLNPEIYDFENEKFLDVYAESEDLDIPEDIGNYTDEEFDDILSKLYDYYSF